MSAASVPVFTRPEHSVPERWADIGGYPGYRVGTTGRVQSRRHPNGLPSDTWRDLKPVPDGHGYPQVRLSRPGDRPRWYFVSRLVLAAFVGPPPSPLHVARHYHDPDPANCNLWNLRWGTQSDNCRDKERHGTAQKGEKHPRWKGGISRKPVGLDVPAVPAIPHTRTHTNAGLTPADSGGFGVATDGGKPRITPDSSNAPVAQLDRASASGAEPGQG